MSANSEPTAISAETVVTIPADLHARPAAQLARAAAGFESAIELRFGAHTVDPGSVLSVMSLGATAGNALVVRADGPDAEEAVQTLAGLLVEAD